MSVHDEVIVAGVLNDADYIGRLFGDLEVMQGSDPSGVIPFCTAPYVALFIYEARRKPQHIDPSAFANLSVEAERICANSRHSLKLFEDTKRKIDGLLDHFLKEIWAKHSRYFLGNTWFPPARLIETDLGIYGYGGRVVSTTHSAAFHLGIEAEHLFGNDGGAYIRRIMSEFGQCFGALGADLRSPGTRTFVASLSGAELNSSDVRAHRYYGRVFNRRATPGMNGLLSDFRTRMNFVDSIVVAGSDVLDLEYTVFKMRYIALYQVLSSLNVLKRDVFHYSRLSPDSMAHVERIVGTPEAEVLLARQVRGFRNTLMHYNLLGDVDTDKVDLSAPLFGLVSNYFPDHDYRSLSEIVDRAIKKTSVELNVWADDS
ncbi:hypothetical protein AB0D57_19135 [Streptomyces sp. NPDC048275]|uniref:hypothetical protein n=1 Tax=Streptomyces sp. NPDC048275 TaxID=3155629 RepID=UPI0033F71E96